MGSVRRPAACHPAGTAYPLPVASREITPLFPWRPAILSPTLNLAFLCNIDAYHLADAGRLNSSRFSRVNILTSTTTPPSPCGTRSDVSRTSRAFSPKIARSSRSSAVSSVSPFGVTLPTKISSGIALLRQCARCQNRPNPSEHLRADVWNIPGNLFRAELGIAGFAFMLFNVDGGIYVFLDQAFH